MNIRKKNINKVSLFLLGVLFQDLFCLLLGLPDLIIKVVILHVISCLAARPMGRRCLPLLLLLKLMGAARKLIGAALRSDLLNYLVDLPALWRDITIPGIHTKVGHLVLKVSGLFGIQLNRFGPLRSLQGVKGVLDGLDIRLSGQLFPCAFDFYLMRCDNLHLVFICLFLPTLCSRKEHLLTVGGSVIFIVIGVVLMVWIGWGIFGEYFWVFLILLLYLVDLLDDVGSLLLTLPLLQSLRLINIVYLVFQALQILILLQQCRFIVSYLLRSKDDLIFTLSIAFLAIIDHRRRFRLVPVEHTLNLT